MNCPDCKHEGRLELMAYIHDEVFKGKNYAVLECVSCGSSIRVLKEQT